MGRLHDIGVGCCVRPVSMAAACPLSGGEQKRLVLEALLRGLDEVLLLDEPDNFLDVPAKRWLEDRLVETPKTVLFVSHDRGAAGPNRNPGRHAGAWCRWEHRLGPRWRLRDVSRGATRAVRTLGGIAPPLGRRARQAPSPRAHVQDEGRLQRRDGLAIPGGSDPVAQVRGGRPLRRPFHGNRMSGCGCVVGAPGNARW